MDLLTRESGLQCQLELRIRKNMLILYGVFSFLSDNFWTYLAPIYLICSAVYDRRIQEQENLPWGVFFEGVGLFDFVCLFAFLNSSEYCGIFKKAGTALPPFSCPDKSSVEKEMSQCLGSKPHEIEDVIDSPFCFLMPLFLFHDFLYFKKLIFHFLLSCFLLNSFSVESLSSA